jgi:hypothetical protein
MRLTEAYAARSVRFLETWEQRGWRMKVYGLAYRGDEPDAELVTAAKRVAERCLPDPAIASDRYGVGFLGVHEGRGTNLVFVDWWANENELRQHAFVSSAAAPLDFVEVTADGLVGCVWDLVVIGFERNAWVAAALLGPDAPDLERYLACRFEAAI